MQFFGPSDSGACFACLFLLVNPGSTSRLSQSTRNLRMFPLIGNSRKGV